MPRKPKPTPTPLPYFLNPMVDADRVNHIENLKAQSAALDEILESVLKFIQPQRIEINEKWQRWWGRIQEQHGWDKSIKMQLTGLRIEIIPSKKDNDDANG